MQIVARENIDINKWDDLVSGSPESSVFSMSWYLDAVAENWCIVVDDLYSAGMALPFSSRMNVKILYTPIFVRYVEWFGDKGLLSEVNDLIRQHFKVIELNLKEKVLGDAPEELIYQKLVDGEREIRSQAKRSIQKAEKKNLSIKSGEDYSSIYGVIRSELESKVQGLNKQSIDRLGDLLNNAQNKGCLKAFHVFDESSEGGILCLENKYSLLYLKGTVGQQTKKDGGMYLAMDHAIKYATEKGLQFDFGGSRVDGVKAFNHNLGGKDHVYYAYVINNGPWWFNLARRLKNKWSKK